VQNVFGVVSSGDSLIGHHYVREITHWLVIGLL